MGTVLPLAKAEAGPTGWRPSRPLGGWLATYGKIGPNGGIVPTQDRQGHVFEAAREIGHIDFTKYLAKGKWNDTHTDVIVGLPSGLEFHDGTTELSKAHKKVGFWSEGHLFDRDDPRSWTMFGDYEPTATDLDRADYYWNLASMLKGVPRPLGFSAQGKMLISPCGKRIIWAAISDNAVCEVPQNPDSTASILELAVPISTGMVGGDPCDACSCPPGARCPVRPMSKGVTTPSGIPVREDLETEPRTIVEDNDHPLKRLIALIREETGCNEATARRWVRRFLKTRAA